MDETTGIQRRLLRNAGVMLGGRTAFGLLNLATNALALRAFGLEALGAALLLHAYARLFSDVVKFQSWQAVLRYGAALDEGGDRDGLRRLLGFTLGVDLAAAALAVAGAILLLPWASAAFDWPAGVAGFAPWFVLCIPFIMQATPNGALRLFDRHDVLAGQHAANAVLRFAGVGLAMLLGAGGEALPLAWFAASVLSGLLVMGAFARLLALRRLAPSFALGWRRAGRVFPGIWRFLALTNAASTLQLAVTHLTTLFVGARLGTEAAGAFELARQFAAAIAKPARVLGPLIFPDLSRLAARADWGGLRRVLLGQIRVGALAALAAAALILVALGPLIGLVYGEAGGAHLTLFRLLLGATLIGAVAFALEPAFLSADKAGAALAIQAAAVAAYLGLAPLLSGLWGLDGIGIAILLHSLLLHGLLAGIGLRLLRGRLAAGAAPGAGAAEGEAPAGRPS